MGAALPGNTALHEAAFHGHLAVVEYLLDYEDGRNTINEVRHTDEVSRSGKVAPGLMPTTRMLFAPPPPPQVNSSGQTALHLASMNDHVEVVSALVAAGARVTVMDLARCTALDLR